MTCHVTACTIKETCKMWLCNIIEEFDLLITIVVEFCNALDFLIRDFTIASKNLPIVMFTLVQVDKSELAVLVT